MQWAQAAQNCLEKGGKMFANVDGTKSQLDFLFDKLGGAYWLGIWTIDHKTWLDTDSQPIDSGLLVWDPSQEFNSGGNQHHVGYWREGKWHYLSDVNQFKYSLYSVCDML